MQWQFKPALAHLCSKLSPREKALATLRAKWGKPGDKQVSLASSFFDLTSRANDTEIVDDQTWSDLEFPEIFPRLDTTVTPLGTQYLFKQLRTYKLGPEQLKERYQLYERLKSDRTLREELQLKLSFLGKDDNSGIADSVFGDIPRKPRYAVFIPYWGLVSVVILLAIIYWSLPWWIWLLILGINGLIIYRTSWNLNKNTEAMKGALRMLYVADRLASIDSGSAPIVALKKLRQGAAARSEGAGALRWLALPRGSVIELVWFWLNLAFLVEIIAYVHSIHRFEAIRPICASTFELIGSLDAAIAMACLLECFPNHCQPVISEHREFVVEQGYHPLLRNPVRNSIRLLKQSALVTGSNMAGKTTFIKMLGVNAILGQTLGVCLADRVTLPQIVVMASISDRQSVASGKSHYFAEVERIHMFLDRADRGEGGVFIIDELFNGTNTTERLAVCRAVLECLGRSATVLVTTHDVELQSLLKDHYQLFHFQENPDVVGFFDYVLRPGAATERNAIRLLNRLKFPAEIVADAIKYSGGTT